MPDVVNWSASLSKGRPWMMMVRWSDPAADVGVGGQGDADVEAPAPAGADLGEEALHVGLDLVGHVAGQDGLEVLPVPGRPRP